MNPAAIYLAILIIWPADATQSPAMAHAVAPSLAVCEASIIAEKAALEANPAVRFVSARCIQFDRGEKA